MQHPFTISEDAVSEAITHISAVKALMRTTDVGMLPPDMQKALSSFSFGSNGFILPPVMSDQILSCVADQTDVTGLMGQVTIAGGSIKFLVRSGQHR